VNATHEFIGLNFNRYMVKTYHIKALPEMYTATPSPITRRPEKK
jgi:hypothetical protein